MNLLEKMLVLDAEQRVTAAEALTHPYFESLQDTEDEPRGHKYDESCDDLDRTLDEWKRECGARAGPVVGPHAPAAGDQALPSEEHGRRSAGRCLLAGAEG